MGEFFPKLWENTSFFPISVTNSSPKLVNPQICPQILGQIRPQIWWILKFWDEFVPNYSNNFMGIFIPKFADIFVPKFGELPNFPIYFGKTFQTNKSAHEIHP